MSESKKLVNPLFNEKRTQKFVSHPLDSLSFNGLTLWWSHFNFQRGFFYFLIKNEVIFEIFLVSIFSCALTLGFFWKKLVKPRMKAKKTYRGWTFFFLGLFLAFSLPFRNISISCIVIKIFIIGKITKRLVRLFPLSPSRPFTFSLRTPVNIELSCAMLIFADANCSSISLLLLTNKDLGDFFLS